MGTERLAAGNEAFRRHSRAGLLLLAGVLAGPGGFVCLNAALGGHYLELLIRIRHHDRVNWPPPPPSAGTGLLALPQGPCSGGRGRGQGRGWG